MQLLDAKKVWKMNADNDGWISKTPSQIAVEFPLEDTKDMEKSLTNAMNYYETKWKDDSETSW